MPFSMALPTTPMRTAASTASGKTQKTSMLLTALAFRRPDQDAPRPEVYIGYVLQGKGQIEILPIFTDHEDFVGAGLEGIHYRSDDLTRVVHGLKADQVSDVELSLFRYIELRAVEQEFSTSQRICVAPVLDAVEVDQEALRG